MKRSHSNTRLARSRCLPTLKPSTRVVPVGVPRCIFDVVSRRSWDGHSPSPFHASSFFFYLHPDSQDDFLYLLEHRKRVSCKFQSPRQARATLDQLGPAYVSTRSICQRVERRSLAGSLNRIESRSSCVRFRRSSNPLPLRPRVGQIEYLAIDSVN